MGQLRILHLGVGAAVLLGDVNPASADDLFNSKVTQSLSADRRATLPGDTITIVVVQAAEATSTLQNGTRRSTGVGGRISAGGFDERANLSLSNSFEGKGETRRSERFVTQMTASITSVLSNGDLEVAGGQRLFVNGEATLVEVRGRVRPTDIDSENRVASNRIADAQIRYDGKGFLSRSAKPGLIQRLFGLLGL